MEYKDGNFIVEQAEIEALLTTDAEPQLTAYFNPQRLKVIWAYLNSKYTRGKKLPITATQYRALVKIIFTTEDAATRTNLEKYFIAFDTASDYAKGVGKAVYHYLAELYALKANMAIYSLLKVLESLSQAKQEGHPEGIETLLRDGVLTEEQDGMLKDNYTEDGRVYFTYAGKTTEDIAADIKRGIEYLYNNLKGFKTDTEGMLRYFEELIPVHYLEPFGMDAHSLAPLSLSNYIYRMQEGFIQEVGIDINETGKGKYKIFPTYDSIKVPQSGVEYQYKAFKKLVENRWKIQ